MKIPSYIKYLLAVIPIIWVFTLIRPEQFMTVIRQTAWWTLPVYFIGILAGYILQGIRWWFLIRAFSPDLSLLATLRIHFIALFYSIVLPSSMSADIVRSVMISKKEDYGTVWAAAWMARLLGVASLLMLAMIAFFFFSEIRSIDNIGLYGLGVIALSIVALLLSFSKKAARPIGQVLKKILPRRIGDIFHKIHSSIYIFRTSKRVLVEVFFLTVLFHVIVYSATAFAIAGITGKLLLVQVFAFTTVIEFICAVIPVTPNGMGLREVLSKQMFAYLGFTDEQLGVYVIVVLIGIALKLAGGFFLIRKET